MLKMLLPLIGLGFSSWCFAQNPLSVHVLNLENGLPSANVKVTLEAQQNDKWTEISSSTTDDQGRINDLYPKDTALQKGKGMIAKLELAKRGYRSSRKK